MNSFMHLSNCLFIAGRLRPAWTQIVFQGFSTLIKLLNPLVNSCLAQTIITESSSQHLQSFCAGFPIFNTKFYAHSLLFNGIHYECNRDWKHDRTGARPVRCLIFEETCFKSEPGHLLS
jgi:hypothetical protein